LDDCCNAKSGELAALAYGGRRRVLQIALAINLLMFVAEFAGGYVARSTSLMADSVDMLGDAFVYGLSLYALARGDRWKAGAAFTKGVVILLFGGWIVFELVLNILTDVTPVSGLMAIFGTAALVANLICLALLWRYRQTDVNMSSTFECSRNDVIANIGVLLAAGGVWITDQAWPDMLAGSLVALVFLRSAVRVIRQSWPLLWRA
jgi:cation diffusion facilitator family transporter